MPLVLPILIPLVAAAASLLGWRNVHVQRGLGITGAIGLFVTGVGLLWVVQRDGIQTAQMGNWPAPYGITLVADHLAAAMVTITGLIGAVVAVYSVASLDEPRQAYAYYSLFNMLLTGVSAAFLTGDLFNLYVWFELLLIASFVLLAFGGERPQIEGAIKYVTLNLVSSFLFLAAVAILYGAVGTLNMADAAQKLDDLRDPDLVTSLATLFLVAFGIKAAVFPLFFWLPASYHTPPVAVSALFAGLLTKVGVYALIRVFCLMFAHQEEFIRTLILAISVLTMLTGVLGAVAQFEFRRILSFHIISQIGYMTLGLGLFTPLGLTGSVFYIIHHIVVKTNLFLTSGVARRLGGSYQLDRLGGLSQRAPGLAVGFAIPALSLAGIPPLSGFVGKFILIWACFEAGQYAIGAIALLTSLLTLFSMAKIWSEAFWKKPPSESGGTPIAARLTWAEAILLGGPIAVLCVVTVLIGLMAGPVFELARSASEGLIDRSDYMNAVLGEAALIRQESL